MKQQVESNHYYKNYDTKERFCSYWHQIQEIIHLNPNTILEIGIGNGFVTNYLKQRGFKVVTIDIDEKLNPNVAGSVLNIPFSNEAFDVVACFELLEHLPYKSFSNALSEIFRVSNPYALLFLRDANRVYRIWVQIPKIGELKKLIPRARHRRPTHHFRGLHYWEIGKASYSLKRIINDITKAGFNIMKTYRVFEIPYHRFCILKKIN